MRAQDYHDLTLAAYRAGLDGSRWQSFVDLIDEKLDGVYVSIYGHDTKGNVLPQLITTRYSQDDLEQYQNYYAEKNLFIPVLMRQPLLRIERSEVWIEEGRLRKSEFYDGFLRPLEDIGTGGGGVLFNDGERLLIMSGQVRFQDQDKADKMIDLFRVLAPHVQQAFEMRQMLHGKTLSGAGYRAAFEEICNALVLLDVDGRICDCNRKAEELFATHDVIALDSFGRLHFQDHLENNQFRKRFLEIATSGVPKSVSAFLVADNTGNIKVARLTPIEHEPAFDEPILDFIGTRKPIALLSIRSSDKDSVNVADALQTACKLSTSEAKLAEALFSGSSLKDYSEQISVSIHTVRTQLKSVFAKTGTSRQGELIVFIHKITN